TAFALLEPVVDFGRDIPGGMAVVPGLIAAVGIGLDLVRRTWCALPASRRRGSAESSDRFLYALTPLAALAAARIVRNEVYLLVNGWGFLSVRPEWIEIGFCTLV